MPTSPVIFVDLSEPHARFLASTLLASRTDGALLDAQGQALCKIGTQVQWRSADQASELPVAGQMDDLRGTLSACGLQADNPLHAEILFGFRNPILRAARGESWVPEIVRRMLIKSYQVDVWPVGEGYGGCLHVDAGPKLLRVASATAGRKGVLGVHVQAEAFRQLLMSNPVRKDWLTFVRSPALRFSDEPLWLKLAMKLI